MKNQYKISALIFLIVLFFITCVSATNSGINMNLISNTTQNNFANSNNDTNNITQNQGINNTNNINNYSSNNVRNVTATSQDNNGFLTIGNILAIILIVIGILLILLGIAILVRFK